MATPGSYEEEIKTEERHALLSITDCCKDDSGPYSITATNELGTDYALINVQVSDCPDPPRWPQASQIGTVLDFINEVIISLDMSSQCILVHLKYSSFFLQRPSRS